MHRFFETFFPSKRKVSLPNNRDTLYPNAPVTVYDIISRVRSRNAKWPTRIHNATEGVIRLQFSSKGPKEQIHVVKNVDGLEFTLEDWPKLEWSQAASVIYLYVLNDDPQLKPIIAKDDITWLEGLKVVEGEKVFQAKEPMIRFWSWGDGVIYADEMVQT